MTTHKKAARTASQTTKTRTKIAAGAGDPKAKGKKGQITLRLDADVIDFFRAMGAGYQSTMSNYLGIAMDDAKMRAATEMPGLPWYEENRNHEAMVNRIFRPRKELITLRIDSATIAYFRSRGKGYQSKMNYFLRLMMVEKIVGKELELQNEQEQSKS